MSEHGRSFAGPMERLDDFRWRIPRSYQPGMLVDGIIYSNDALMEKLSADNSPQQVANVACLPGIVGHSMGMPDIHYGYGFPIGGVAAMDARTGVVSPGGVGYDINCGVRLMRTDLTLAEVEPRLNDLVTAMYELVPAGVGSTGAIRARDTELDAVAVQGAEWAVRHGLGTEEDLRFLEEGGRLAGADPIGLSPEARKRAKDQLGTLGSGNHFLEVQVVEEITQPAVAEAFGLTEPGQVVVFVHTGSRGLGHQVCDDYLRVAEASAKRHGIALPDRQLACMPLGSKEADEYLGAMAGAANFAFANRQLITHWVREAFARVFGKSAQHLGLELVYDVAHNIAKMEEYEVEGQRQTLCVHRKGATRAFPADSPAIPAAYRPVGQPVLIPGDMGRYSYVAVGTQRALDETFGSTCHGAGRMMSRHEAKRRLQGVDLVAELARQGIVVRAADRSLLAEEAPQAYKDVVEVIETVEGAGISRRVARLRPMGVVKG